MLPHAAFRAATRSVSRRTQRFAAPHGTSKLARIVARTPLDFKRFKGIFHEPALGHKKNARAWSTSVLAAEAFTTNKFTYK